MNLRNVLSAYSKLRQLTDDESALLETLRGLNDAERELLVESLSPASKGAKKPGKKGSSKPASKSSRASGMAAAIAKSLSHGKPTGEGPICKICSHAEDYEDHSQPSPHYHPFEPSGSTAQPARGRSSTNGGAGSGTQNIETERGVAGVAVGGSSE